MPLAYSSAEWAAIEKFLDHFKDELQRRITAGGIPLPACTVDHFIPLVVALAAEKGGPPAQKLTKNALSFEGNRALMAGYLDRLKGAKPVWPGVPANQTRESEDSVIDLFPDLDDAAIHAAKRAGIETSPLFSVPLADGPYCHKTVPGAAGVAIDGSSTKKVTLFYQAHGGEYYLVAWGVHFGKTRDGKDAVYQVRGVAPGCILKKGYTLRPPGK